MDRKMDQLNRLCTLVVSSCDHYEDLWGPFFKLLKIHWPTMQFPIVLNTESKVYRDECFDVRCMQLFSREEGVSWGTRLKETLKRIESEYILFMLDDFFIDGTVNEDKVSECISWMEHDKSISVFSFMETFDGSYDDGRYPGFERRKQIAGYRFNCQAAIWRRKHLVQYLRNGESPWEWETYGNWRSYRYLSRKFYSKKADAPQVIPYLFKAGVGKRTFGGLVIFRGQFYKPLLDYFNEKYSLNLSPDVRGFIDDKDIDPQNTPICRPRWKEKLIFLQPAYHKVLMIKNILLHFKYLF